MKVAFAVRTLAITVVVAIAVLAVTLAVTARTFTPPIRDASGRIVEGSIAEVRRVELGGWKHYVLVRGRSRTAPILIFVHGGPGVTEMPLFRVFNAALENDFIVVNWDQRGAGKSYSSRLDPATLTMERMREDLGELVDRLRAEFRQDRVLLVCHSWGTQLCLEYISRRPETVAAYVGVAQFVNEVHSDRLGTAWALKEALRKGAQQDAAALRALGSPPYSHEEVIRQRSYIWKYGGGFRGMRSQWDLLPVALSTPEVSWLDYFAVRPGSSLSLDALWPTVERFDARTDHRRVGAPVYLFLGRHDHNTSATLAAEYFDLMEAPRKELVWFENSAHEPPFEEPDRFNAEIRRVAIETGLLPRAMGENRTTTP